MKKHICLVLLFALVTPSYTQESEGLEMRIMGFCAVATLTSGLTDRQVCQGIADICNVGDAIDALDPNLGVAFVFVKNIRQMQLQHPSVYEGRKAKPAGPGTLVFLTDPIPALHGGILVFVSTTAPSRVAIFSLNPDLKGALVYDSFDKPKYFSGTAEVKGYPIEAIGEIRVGQNGSIVVTEHTDEAMEVARKFKLAYEDGKPKLEIVDKFVATTAPKSHKAQ